MTRSFARFFSAVCVFFITLCIESPLFSEPLVDNTYGWALDMPEGFKLSDATDDGTSYLFSYANVPVVTAIKLYKSGTYESSAQAFDGAVGKLPDGKGEKESFEWRSADSSLGTFSMKLGGVSYKGWALAVELPLNGAHIAVLCYANERNEKNCEPFILSILNSLAVDRGSYREEGIVARYAYPAAERKDIELSINGRTIRTSIGAEDEEASDFVIDMEFAVLKMYAASPLWKEAWQRYYRAIFRDSCGRLKRTAFDVQSALMEDAAAVNPEHPDTAFASLLLTWVQGFRYERKINAADFTSLPAALTGSGSDCDTRSLLLCALLENAGTKCALFVSRDYSHALFGAFVPSVSPKENARMSAGGKDFLLGETTAHVSLGLIASDFSDPKKWIAVELP